MIEPSNEFVLSIKEMIKDKNEKEAQQGKKTLTIMTCWLGGTTWKRLIVQAEQK